MEISVEVLARVEALTGSQCFDVALTQDLQRAIEALLKSAREEPITVVYVPR